VSAVGPAEFAHYAAQLGLDVRQYSDPSKPLGILLDHTDLSRGGKLYDFDILNLKPGDTITVSKISDYSASQAGDAATPSLTWTVGVVNPPEAPLGFLGRTTPLVIPELIVSDAVFDGLSDRLLQLGPINPGAMYIQSSGDTAAAVEAIKRLYKATVGGNFSYYSVAEFNQSNNLKTLLINLFFYGFLALITLIGVINIINTLDTNIKLRRREIAMLKSVGLTPGGFRRMLRYESLFYGLTALLYGLPLGIALSVLIYYQFGGVTRFAFSLPWGAILACVLGVLVIVFATMMFSGAMIRNDNIVDTLKEENV
jgi:putative ABC transport system permease protein